MKNNKILIIAAHPDDEVLGCFGTIAKYIQQGYEAYTLILGEGKTSRDINSKNEQEILEDELFKANNLLGIKKVFRKFFPDNAFDKIPLLEIVKSIEEVKNEIKPNIIFTHYEKDLNIDHQITYKATITATRSLQEESVKEIYSFEILSSTEWNYPLSFQPDVFFDISATLDLKLKAMSFYQSELRNYPHPRSLEGIKINAQYQGMRVGLQYAEVFKSVKVIK
ncbi:PIG-L family deacetylase [Campylobacter sp. RKI_CA19_01128]|uniref:PIG-L deacetylase family protein n=1 Tax=unclassified Campylobacter TaxID=2593542 RepID=UPI0018341353|nr:MULTISPECIES: PIG-L deacetylase family protein [unclassified Campylobacter]EAH6869417.1 PIG-L family deacetylase [Campylobacter lari]MCV3354808.1 PIG-L family deacetylase [Campylobacter sp. RKI_CA19_01128]MCV3470092.1 PIG-L family deacetylase [Campylobacter sp. CNRCH_2015_0814]HEC1767657.1 PIG-L family deacetylase [Campylobacter lari]